MITTLTSYLLATILGTNPMTKQNEPALVDQVAFWNTLHNQVAGLSDDGQTVARMDITPERKRLVISTLKGAEREYDLGSLGHIAALNFSPDGESLILTEDPGGSEKTQLHRLRLKDGEITRLTNQEDKNEFLQFKNEKDLLLRRAEAGSSYFDIISLNVETGRSEMFYKNSRYAQVFLDSQGHMRVGKVIEKSGDISFWDLAQDRKMEALTGPATDQSAIKILKVTPENVYYLDGRSGNLSQFKKLALSNHTETLIFESDGFEIVDQIWDETTETPLAVCVESDKRHWHAISGRLNPVLTNPNASVAVVAQAKTSKDLLVRLMTDRHSGSNLVIEPTTDRSVKLPHLSPILAEKDLAPTQTFTFPARDRLKLLTYFTAAEKQTEQQQPPPAILLVHGGPWDRDRWEYHPMVQWLANRGYAVIRVNYRGSSGFGSAFKSMGNGNWGRAMQTDLIDALEWYIQKGMIDKDRVGIVGQSYGGYAVLSALTQFPDRFKAGVDIVGISNLETILESLPKTWLPELEKYYRLIGDPRTAAGRADLQKYSPVHHAQNITAPLLIAQGANDPRVPQRESDQMVEQLQQGGTPHIYALFSNEGHGLRQPGNRLAFHYLMENFLAFHLGGRAQKIAAQPDSTLKVLSGAELVKQVNCESLLLK